MYITTVFIFLVTPGPSHILMLSTSLTAGFNKSWATAAGDLTANLGQIIVASIGLVSFLFAFQDFFIIVKWAGVAYLVYLGLSRFLKKDAEGKSSGGGGRPPAKFYWQGFVTSAANPKAVIFFAALFPQFINPTEPTAHQFVVLGTTYLVIDGCFLVFYGYFAGWAANRFEKHVGKYSGQISGSLLICSALLLGLKDLRAR
jgi:threonine/homoserine/homoserine lactone efflux protein